MSEYRIKNVGSGRYLNLHTNTTGTAVPSACPISIYDATGSTDQVFVHGTYSGKAVLRLKRNSGYALNKHSGDSSCIAWALAANSINDSEYTTATENGNTRIKLVNYNLYLTAESTANGAKCYWRAKTNNSRQYWSFEAYTSGGGTGGTSKTLSMPLNVNQKYKNHPTAIRNSGCALCCGLDVSRFFGTSSNNNMTYFVNNYWTSNGYTWGSPNATMTEGTYSLSKIKTEIDAGRPVIVHATKKNSAGTVTGQHWVVAYKYVNSCKAASDITVLDPYNSNTESATGSVRSLPSAMQTSVGSGYAYGRIKTCKKK